MQSHAFKSEFSNIKFKFPKYEIKFPIKSKPTTKALFSLPNKE